MESSGSFVAFLLGWGRAVVWRVKAAGPEMPIPDLTGGRWCRMLLFISIWAGKKQNRLSPALLTVSGSHKHFFLVFPQ